MKSLAGEKLPFAINSQLPESLQQKRSVAHLSPIGIPQVNKEIEHGLSGAIRREKRKDLGLQFNSPQMELRSLLIQQATEAGRTEEVANLIKATSVPELRPHLQELFCSLQEEKSETSRDRKRVKMTEDEND